MYTGNYMNMNSKNKIATAVTAALLLTSASALADTVIFSDDLEGLTGFESGFLVATAATAPMPDPILAWNELLNADNFAANMRAYYNQTGWGRFQTTDITAAALIPPAGNDTTIFGTNKRRKNDAHGLGRQVDNIQAGKTYNLSGDGANKGSLRWAYSYSMIGATVTDGVSEVTTVSLTNIVVSDNTWQTVTDTFVAPDDIDVAQPFHVFIQTPPSAAFPTTGGIDKDARATMWVDNLSMVLIEESVEYIPENEIDTVTPTVAWPAGAIDVKGDVLTIETSAGTVPAYSKFDAGWGDVWVVDNTATGWWASPEPYAGDQYLVHTNWRHLHANGIAREIESIIPGGSYALSADAAARDQSFVWNYSYTKLGEDVVTTVPLTNQVASDGAWIVIEDTFTAPDDIDATKPFKVHLSTVGDGEIAFTDRNTEIPMWAANFSLMGPPSLADTDGDGVPDSSDAFPDDASVSVDTDGDGFADDYNASCDVTCQEASTAIIDDDDDNDGVLDVNDADPLDNSVSVIISFANDSGTVVEGEEFTVDASSSVPNSDNATYTWDQDSGLAVDLMPAGNMVSFIAPTDTTQVEEVVISLTVAGDIHTVSDTYTVKVTKAPSVATAAATITGMLDSEGVLAYGEKIQLDGSTSTDSDGGELTYQWKVIGVPVEFSDATGVNTSFYVPLVKSDTAITIELTVTNYLRDYDGSYILDGDTGAKIVSESDTFEIATTVKKTFPEVLYPLEYFPDGDLESVSNFPTSGWAIGSKGFGDAPTIFLSGRDENGDRIQAYGQHGSPGWARFIDNTRTQNEGGIVPRPPGDDYSIPNVVAYWNQSRQLHSGGITRQVEGIVSGGTYTVAGDGLTYGSLQWSLLYSVVGAPVNPDNGISDVTEIHLTNTIASDGAWANLSQTFIAPTDIDVAQPFKVKMHTVGDEEVMGDRNNATSPSRLWTDNFSLKELSVGLDTDEDGVIDINDGFPNDSSVAADTDGDGLPDSFVKSCDETCQGNSSVTLDDDDDNDGILDVNDGYPQDSKQSIKLDTAYMNNVFEGQVVSFDASESLPSADISTYTWTQVSGLDVTLTPSATGDSVMFTADSELTQVEVIEVMLTIETDIASVSKTYSVSINNAPSVITPSLSVADMAAVGVRVVAGETITVDATATTDSEDGALIYSWRAINDGPTAGITFLDDSATATSFIVPEINIDMEVVIQLTVSNYFRDFNGDYLDENGDIAVVTEATVDENGDSIAAVDTRVIWATTITEHEIIVVKTESEKPDAGSFGIFGMMLLGGLAMTRRLLRVKK